MKRFFYSEPVNGRRGLEVTLHFKNVFEVNLTYVDR